MEKRCRMGVRTGLDRLAGDDFAWVAGRRWGLLCNQATIDRHGRHVLQLTRPNVLFSPQHGLFGHTQDNMIEWEGGEWNGMRVHSLYGERRKPAPEWLQDIELLVIDLPDIGSRYYTFAWTMALCLEACAEAGVRALVLDRPNPLGGVVIEGPEQDVDHLSFVGLHPIPIRHGRTLGELARWMQATYYPGAQLDVLEPEGWHRDQMFWDTGLPWMMPSPNMPTPETALVYPGACLLEGTNISEGRGTTRPFEIVGAPWINGDHLASVMNEREHPGVWFRPLTFQPTFQKHAGEVCGGVFVSVHDRAAFRPVATYVDLLHVLWRLSDGRMTWKQPPYEYEFVKLPIDILWGSPALRLSVESGRGTLAV
jgi:uncharacterized protein YbbC (DUF1343 family)